LRSRSTAVIAFSAVCALILGACGGSSGSSNTSKTNAPTTIGVTGATEDPNVKPTPGGSVTYGLEADTTGGWCLQEAQLAISGIQVARTIYDTLTMPDSQGQIKPYLAQTVTPNANATVWTIVLRPNIKFSDGTPLNADIVRDNLLAYAGKYPKRHPLLFGFTFSDVANVVSAGPMTVRVTTKRPWPAFAWYLWGSSRVGIEGRAQLDSPNKCNTNLIGTGPFKEQSWVPNQSFVAVRNPNYWQKDKFGQQLPYLDKITYVPVESGPDRLKALEAGDFQMIHTDDPPGIIQIRNDVKAGTLKSVESDRYTEVSYNMTNATTAPFNNQHARNAIAYAVNRDEVNKIVYGGILTPAQGPFAPGNVGYLESSGLPSYDPAKAQQEVAAYKQATGQNLTFTITYSTDPTTTKVVTLLQQMWRASGITAHLRGIGDQSQLINIAIGRQFQLITWRNHPGADPDTQYVWWHCNNTPPAACDNPVNFSGFNDAQINSLLDQGRVTLDPAKRATIYEDLNRRFAQTLYDQWGSYVIWDIAFKPNIHGIYGPPLPDGSQPFEGLPTGHPVLGLWIQH
jgi:peptide/nickel transport system substrate-binding protein